jgi:C1A family cysteine protease
MRPNRPENLLLFRILLICSFLVFLPIVGSPASAARSLSLETLNPNAYIVVTPLTTTPPQMVTCNAPCACMLPSDAEAQWGPGGYAQCNELPCGRQVITTTVAAVPVTKYCYRSNNYAVIETSIIRQRVCGAGLVPCSGTCVNTGSDPANCGSCGNSCSASQVCMDGQCGELAVPVFTTINTSGVVYNPTRDRDGDGIPDSSDNCPDIYNPDQKESEPGIVTGCSPAKIMPEGAVPGICSIPPDNVGDSCDNCWYATNPDQKDSDGNCGLLKKDPFYWNAKTGWVRDPHCGDACDCNDGLNNNSGTDKGCSGSCGPPDPCTMNPLPGKFDWRNWQGRNWVSPVKMPGQGTCGSCYAFGSIAGVESAYNIKADKPVTPDINLSEQWYVSGGFGGCSGGFPETVLADIQKNGPVTETCFPFLSSDCGAEGWFNASELAALNKTGPTHMDITYNSTTKLYDVGYCIPKCSLNVQCANPATLPAGCAPSVKIKGFNKVNPDTDSIKRALLCHGPLVVSSEARAHTFLVVGWDDCMTFPDWPTRGGWVWKNSWGLSYGDKGFGYLPYDHPFTDFKKESYWVEV